MNEQYKKWRALSRKLLDLKEEEAILRAEICKRALADKVEGTTSLKEEGVTVAATAVVTRTIDRDTLESIWPDLSDEEREAVDFRPTLVISKYRGIAEDSKLHEAITAKAGRSQLRITLR